MLQVRANSWHYWVWSLGRSRSSTSGIPYAQPKNLCLYFWHCALKIGLALFIAGLALTGAAAIVYLIASFPVIIGKGIVLIAIAAVVFIALGYLVGAGVDRRKATKHERMIRHMDEKEARRKRKEAKQPSLLWAFIKAKKQKYCPMIQVVDKDG